MFFFRAGWLLLCLLFLLPLTHSEAGDIGENRQQLAEIQQRIDEAARNLSKKRKAAKGLDKDLQTVTREEKRLRERVDALEREATGLRERLTEKTAQLEKSRAQTARLQAQVSKRLAAIYKGGESGSLRLFFAESSPARLSENYDNFARIVRGDRELLKNYRQQLQDLEEAQRHLGALQQQRQNALAESQAEQRQLQQALRLKKKLLARMQQEEAFLVKQLADLRERATRLGTLIKKLESTKSPEYTQRTVLATRKGSLPWPVAGRIRIGFGTSRHPELGTLHDSQGIEIEVSGEQPISAVWPGQVIFADNFRGFGKMIILDHGEGYYTLYAQASRLSRKVGEQVAGGATLAYSGDAEGRGVYFEVRHHGVPLNPADWLGQR